MKDNFNDNSLTEQGQEEQSDHDSLFGSLLFEAFCGGAISELFAESVNMPEQARELDVSNALDLYEEYRRDRTNGGFTKTNDVKLGVYGALFGMFNRLGDQLSEDLPVNSPHIAQNGLGSYVTTPSFS